jgi:hypothetical protein
LTGNRIIPLNTLKFDDDCKNFSVHFIANAHYPGSALIPHTIQKYKPKPGDLICANRGKSTPTKVIEELPDSLNYKLHCGIVVETKSQTLEAIGGNVRNSVSKTILTLSPEGIHIKNRGAPFRYHSEKEGAAGNISAPKVGHKRNTEM